MNKVKTFFLKVIKNLDNNRFINLSDERKIKIQFKLKMGKNLNLNNPITFNEKLQWLKLNDRKEIYSKMVDKYEAKKYVSELIGNEYIIPTIGIYDSFDDIDFNALPNQFVIKCTHDSGGLVICDDKNKFDIKAAKKKINHFLKRKYYYIHREWPYKNIKPRIIIEKFMKDDNIKGMRDYKFFCFDGEPKIFYVSDGSHSKHPEIAFFDMNFNQLDIKRCDYYDYEKIPSKPNHLNEMIKLARILSKNIKHVRVDFYEINNQVYFGELTFHTGGGYIPFVDEKWDNKIGEMLILPKK